MSKTLSEEEKAGEIPVAENELFEDFKDELTKQGFLVGDLEDYRWSLDVEQWANNDPVGKMITTYAHDLVQSGTNAIIEAADDDFDAIKEAKYAVTIGKGILFTVAQVLSRGDEIEKQILSAEQLESEATQ